MNTSTGNKLPGWYVTKMLDASALLDGPFDSRDACIKRCLERSSELTLARAMVTKSVKLYYTPRYYNGGNIASG